MQVYRPFCILSLAAASIAPAQARSVEAVAPTGNAASASSLMNERAFELPKKPANYLECVPYARRLSGIQIYGDAHTWWDQAKTRYARGQQPKVGAVMAMRPHNNSRLGHVATVSRIVDDRTILLSHANWSVPGEIEQNVVALDVSPENDWSRVRIWYAPSRGLGNTHWPVSGFIYNAKPGSIREATPPTRLATSTEAPARSGTRTASRSKDPIGAIIAGAY